MDKDDKLSTTIALLILTLCLAYVLHNIDELNSDIQEFKSNLTKVLGK